MASVSLPSYKLSKSSDGIWWAEGEFATGKPFRIDCGKGSRDRAEGFLEMKLRHKANSSIGSQARWKKWHERRAAAGAAPAAPGSPTPQTAASATAPARQTDEEIRAKLIGLGDSQPLEADKVFPASDDGTAGAAADPSSAAAADDADDLDTEGAELIASLLAKGAVLGLVGLVNRQLKKRKPPQQAEPHEKGLEWFHDGMEHHLTKLLGKTATLGPTGKIFAGATIIVGSMFINAEPIAGASDWATKREPEPSPPAPPPVANHAANGVPETALARPAPQGIPLGVFGVEKTVAN